MSATRVGQVQPDCFETPDNDFQEGLINPKPMRNKSDDIEETYLDHAGAINKFRGELDSTSADFSGNLAGRAGYAITYERDAQATETPQQRLARLQTETADLLGELSAAEKSQKLTDGVAAKQSLEMLEQVKQVQAQLAHASLQQKLVAAGGQAAGGVQADITKLIISELGKFNNKAAVAAGENPAAKPEGSSSTVTYELYMRAEQAKFTQLTKLAELEQRVHKMEAAIGPNCLAAVASEIGDPQDISPQEITLHTAVSALTKRVAALSYENIGDLQGRIQIALELAKKKPSLEATNSNGDKIQQLYEMGKRSDTVVAVIPDLIDRLKALRALHEQAAEVARSVATLEQTAKQLTAANEAQTSTLTTVQASLAKNMAVIEGNFAAMEKRIAALARK